MKNLKKVLALVLVVATLFGFAAVAGATDFTDAASVKNTEAVEVMNALGVINGYTDGSFKPNGNVTRAEMAKMVTFILNGGEDVGPLYSAANVFTDCGYHWARGYIAYASNVKLVAGVGGNKFNPDGNVTGVEAAKMLLCALGYDADAAGYVGTTWASKVLADAKSAGLLSGFARNFDYSAPLSRDNAALMMFNALKAPMVEYSDKGSSITVGGVEIVAGAKAPEKIPAEANNITGTGSSAHEKKYVVDDLYLNLGEDCFDSTGTKGFVATSAEADGFGRPAHEWKYDGDSIGTYAETPDVSYTEQVNAGTIYTDIGKVKSASIVYTIDGVESHVYDSKSDAIKSGNTTDKFGGQGTLTEVFVDDDEITIVEIGTYFGQITKWTKASLDKNGDVIEGKEEKITISGGAGDFKTTAFTADDEDSYVLYTKANGDVQEVIVPETVSGTMSRYTNSEITVGGTKYSRAAHEGTFESIVQDDFDGTYTYYLDTYGNVIGSTVEEAGSTTNYVYVVSMKATNDSFASSTAVQAKVIYTDGKQENVNVNTFKDNKIDSFKDPTKPLDGNGKMQNTTVADAASTWNDDGKGVVNVGKWVSYSTNSDNKYTFTPLGDYADTVSVSGATLTKDSATIAGTSYYLNSKTVVTNIDDNNKVTSFTGLPTKNISYDATSLLITHAKGSLAATAVYAVNQSKGLSTEDVTYAYAFDTTLRVNGKDAAEFIIDGEKVTYITEGETITQGLVYDLTVSDEEVTDATEVTIAPNKYVMSDGDGVLRVKNEVANTTASGTYTQTDDYTVYDATADGDGSTTSLSENDRVTIVLEDGKAAVVFVTAFAE